MLNAVFIFDSDVLEGSELSIDGQRGNHTLGPLSSAEMHMDAFSCVCNVGSEP